jgi:hypothetical protein
MKKPLAVRDSIAVHLLQAIICKRENIRPSPKEAAQLAVEHTDCLINELDKKKGGRGKVSYLKPRIGFNYREDRSKKKVFNEK